MYVYKDRKRARCKGGNILLLFFGGWKINVTIPTKPREKAFT